MSHNHTILAVDDSADALALLVEILSAAGYQVLPASSGELALAAVAARPPDLILLDVRMRGMDGFDVCRRLKADAATRLIPIILISAFANVREWVEGLQLGAADYITKPFQPEELLARVGTHLALGRANVSLQAEIAEHKRTAQVLRESQADLARAESVSHIMVTHVGLDGRWLKVPPQLCQLLGGTEADLLARRVQDFSLPEYAEADWAQYQRLPQSDLKSFSSDKRFRRRDGQVLWLNVSTTLVTNAAGQPVHFLTYLRDITEAKAASEKVRAQARLLDLSQDAILVRDLTGAISYWNQGAQKIYGWTAEEAIRSTDHLPADMHDPFLHACLNQARQTGEWTGEVEKTTKAGAKVIVYSRWSMMRDSVGLPQSILIVETNISAQKKLEGQFLRAQRMEAIGALAGGIAHDLNNVLAPILLSLEMLKARLDTEQDFKLLSSMETCAQRGADLVRQVLAFARGVEGQRFVVNPNHLVRDIQKITKETFPVNIAFEFKTSGALWTVTGDPTQLHQVIMNLCVNARDAMPDGGKLTLTMENLELDELQASMHPDSKPGPHVLLTVSDTGTGIPKAIQHKIFEPFFTTKETGKGTGLGLATSATIVKSHGGFITLYSEPGRGATFKVYLPANTAAQAPDGLAIEPSPFPRGNGELVLMVDDEESIRTAIQQTLEIFGYRVLLAIHGAEAVALYAQHRHDIAIVITDMAMPVMDGPATIAALKMMNPQVKIIGSSGLASGDGAAKAVAAGIIHFVPKPYTAETMLKVLAKALHGPMADGR
jgi:PAS domain S-box-containing protein